MDVVVVESPAKAKTINKYLGNGYTVLASYGHVRDLVNKDGSVRPDEDFAMDWDVDSRANKRLSEIAAAVKGARHLYLATDPDREGEAISWHVLEVLEKKRALKDVDVQRIVFNEITKKAVLDAIQNPRAIDSDLVDAYLARRALDYLVGFTLSPVLWRKLPGSRSAGRVQSVALRLVCEREAEIEIFRPQEYWSIEADLTTPREEAFTARLVRHKGEKLDRLSIGSEGAANEAVAAIEAADFTVTDVERKEVKRNPAPPFTTSTLQQEASRKLRLGASQTMRLAQQLYEGVSIGGETVGLITYMRTDSVTLSGEAIAGCRRLIERDYGADYVPESPRVYKTKSKNAQEAHEAIRPTDLFRTPGEMKAYLDREQLRLYELIWKRTIACEMESAVLDQVSVAIDSADRQTGLRATGSVLKFDGFLKLYREDRDDTADGPAEDEKDRLLPRMDEGEGVDKGEIRPEQHFTQPPPRYTEASLVKRLEELGIGRPSTYASILQVLQDRNYVTLEKRRFTPEDRGRVVTSFLMRYFPRYVEYDFTAGLEEQLDDISGGRIDYKTVLRNFWQDFYRAVEDTKDLKIRDVIDALDEELGPHFFPPQEDGSDPRVCPQCADGRLGLKIGKFGGFIGCSNHPDCKYTRQLAVAGDPNAVAAADRELGIDPETGKTVWVKVGPYGPYIQLGEPTEEEKKPKRVSLPKGLHPDEVDLELALKLLALPREVGLHPEGGTIKAGIGRYGPYVQLGNTYANLPEWAEVFEVGINRAVDLIEEKKKKGGGGLAGRHVGDHPETGRKIVAGEGRFGPYVKLGRLYASLPDGMHPDDVTLDQAVDLLKAREEAKKAKDGKKPAAKKKPAKKKAAPRKKKAEPEPSKAGEQA